MAPVVRKFAPELVWLVSETCLFAELSKNLGDGHIWASYAWGVFFVILKFSRYALPMNLG
jgi:hypothetical protein